MTVHNIHSPQASAQLFVTAGPVTSLAFAPGLIRAADKDAHEDRTEQRTRQLHAKRMITSAQKEQWMANLFSGAGTAYN